MSQSPLERNLDGILPPGEVVEEIVELMESTPLSEQQSKSYHDTRWPFLNIILGRVDTITRGKAGLLQRVSTFLIIGGTCALLNLIIQGIMLKLLPGSLNETTRNLTSSLVGTELSLIVNFSLNDYFTFRHLPGHQRSVIMRFLRFHLTALGGVILTTLIELTLATLLHINPTIAQAIAIIIVLFYNFIVHHLFTYRHIKTKTAHEIVS